MVSPRSGTNDRSDRLIDGINNPKSEARVREEATERRLCRLMCGGGYAPPATLFSSYWGCAPKRGPSPKEISKIPVGRSETVRDLPHIGRQSLKSHVGARSLWLPNDMHGFALAL